jgi:hypothetical protein
MAGDFNAGDLGEKRVEALEDRGRTIGDEDLQANLLSNECRLRVWAAK